MYLTSSAVIDFVLRKLNTVVDKVEYSAGILLELAQAFDTVNTSILLDKLEHDGLRGSIPQLWFKNYISNRKQYVQCNGIDSQMIDITYGAPQGFVLGPPTSIFHLHKQYNCFK